MTENLTEYFKRNLLNRGNHENPTNPGPTLADAAYTLQTGRQVFPYRGIVVCKETSEASEILASGGPDQPGRLKTFHTPIDNPFMIFMFPGQGAQYVNMGLDLYKTEPVFRQEMDRCFNILNPLMGYDIKEILYPHSDCRGGSPCPPGDCVRSPYPPDDCVRSAVQGGHGEPPLQSNSISDQINRIEIALPIIFIFGYALAKLLL